MEHSKRWNAAHSLSTTSAHQLPPCPASLYRSCYFSSCQQTLPTKTPRSVPSWESTFHLCSVLLVLCSRGPHVWAFIFGIHPLPAGQRPRHLELCRVKDSHLSPTRVLVRDRKASLQRAWEKENRTQDLNTWMHFNKLQSQPHSHKEGGKKSFVRDNTPGQKRWKWRNYM